MFTDAPLTYRFSRRRALGLLASGATFALAGVQLSAEERLKGEALRKAFVRRFDRPRVPLAPQPGVVETKEGIIYENWTIASEAGQRVPLLIARGEGSSGRRPAVVGLHGLGGRKESMFPALDGLVRRGFIAVALDARYHGDRVGDLPAAMIASFNSQKERPYLWDTVWDTWRTLDYLATRPDISADRLGLMGISLGGHTTWMASADPRVKVAVPCISVCSWQWQLDHEGYTQRVKNLQRAFDGVKAAMGEAEVTAKVVAEAWRRWLPGIPYDYDCQDLLAAFAPRPLLVINGDSDPVAPLDGVKEAWLVIESAYRNAGSAQNARLFVAEKSGHTITAPQRETILDWFSNHLRG